MLMGNCIWTRLPTNSGIWTPASRDIWTLTSFQSDSWFNRNGRCLSGSNETDAQKLCDCTVGEFQRQYSMEEFQQLTLASATDAEAETALVEVGQFCFEQILYEE